MNIQPHSFLCGLARQQAELLISVIRFCCCSRQEPRPQSKLWGFCFWTIKCGTSVVWFEILCNTSEPKQRTWANF